MAQLYNHEAEASIIGSILRNNECLDYLPADLAEDFTRVEYKTMYEICIDMHLKNMVIDTVSLWTEIQRTDRASDVGGIGVLTSLLNSTLSAHLIKQYIATVRELGTRRRLINTYKQAVTDLTLLGVDYKETAQKAIDNAVNELNTDKNDTKVVSIKDQSLRFLQQLENHELDNRGVATGIPDFDSMTGGLQPKTLVILGARPGMGKSTLAVNIAEYIAGHGGNVYLSSLEMGKEELMKRIMASHSLVSVERMRNSSNLSNEDWQRLLEGAERLSRLDIGIDDDGGASPEQIAARAMKWKAQHEGKIDLLIIDYLQIMNIKGFKADNQIGKITYASRYLKELSKKLDCPILCLSQLNRGLSNRQDKRPTLADLRDSGSIEQDADIVMFLHNNDYFEQPATENPFAEPPTECKQFGIDASLIVAKHRAGRTGTIPLKFLKEQNKFVCVAEES